MGRSAIQATVAVLMLVGLLWLGYFTLRSDFLQVFLLFLALFILYCLVLWKKLFNDKLRIALGIAVLLRLSLLFMTPNLSDDYFRFIWDGLFVAGGRNPFLMTPSAYIDSGWSVPGADLSLFRHLNSPDYYSVYPPFCQYIFGLSARICGANILANVILIRAFVLAAEVGTLALLYKIGQRLRMPPDAILIYALNPLVIVELAGNLHPEAFMIFFVVLAVYLLMKGRQSLSAVSFGLSVGAKLVPLIFLPLLIRRLGRARSMAYFAIVGGTFVVLFLPFLTATAIFNYLTGLAVYFRLFEFNASVYYLGRWIGYLITGYNVIAFLGPAMAAAAFISIVLLAVREKTLTWVSLLRGMLFCGTLYLIFSTTVHPWYITPLIALSVFAGYRYVLVWSLFVVLSYSSYQSQPYLENLWLVAAEYVIVGACMLSEMVNIKWNDLLRKWTRYV